MPAIRVSKLFPICALAAFSACHPTPDASCPSGTGRLQVFDDAAEGVTIAVSDEIGAYGNFVLGPGQGISQEDPVSSIHLHVTGSSSGRVLLDADAQIKCDATTTIHVPGSSAHPLLPQLFTRSGPMLERPEITAITFEGDTLAPSIEQFVHEIGGSSYWSAAAEYGVGAASAKPPVRAQEAAPAAIDDRAIQQWLASKLRDSRSGLGEPDGNSIYVLFYPATTQVTAQGLVGCTDFLGYHGAFELPGTRRAVAYAVILRCTEPGVSDLDGVTRAASHELVEAASDPYPGITPAWGGVDPDHAIWETLLLGELGDLCAQFPDSEYVPRDLPFSVQRFWSDASAVAGHDPCSPVDAGQPYFNSAPVLTDAVTYLDASATPISTRGAQIALGRSKTVELDLYSDAPTQPWTVSAHDLSGGAQPQLEFSFSSTTGSNGDRIQMTIHALAQDPVYRAEPFVIESTLGQTKHFWLGVVGNPAPPAPAQATGASTQAAVARPQSNGFALRLMRRLPRRLPWVDSSR